MAKEALTSSIRIEYRDDRILRITIHPNAKLDTEQTQLNYDTAQRLTGADRVAVLVDARAEHQITRRAQELASSWSHQRVAVAVVTASTLTRFLTMLYVTLFRPVSPVRLFSDPALAESWLRQQLDQEVSERRAG